MALDKNKVKILTSFEGSSYDEIMALCFQKFLDFCHSKNIVERSNQLRTEIEESVDSKNYSEKYLDIKKIPVCVSYFEITKGSSVSKITAFGECHEEEYHSVGHWYQSISNKDDRRIPNYSIHLTNDLIEACLRSNFENQIDKLNSEHAIDFLNQIARSRILEKMDEKYLEDKYLLFIFSDPVKKTYLETIMENGGRTFKEKCLHALCIVNPNSSANYERVESPQEKKLWLNSLCENQKAMFIKKKDSIITYDISVPSFINTHTEKVKKSKKRKTENDDESDDHYHSS